jgi:hypothetical protein
MAEPQKASPPARPVPLCPNCRKPMTLVTVSPDTNFINLNIHDYSCDCGKDTSFLISHED